MLADVGGIHRYHSGVETSPINEGTPASGLGAERTCHLYDGNHIQERVVESIDEQKLSIEIFETSMPLKDALGVFTLTALPSGGTLVTVTMQYAVKYGLIGKVMDILMLNRMLGPAMNQLLTGLDHHITTGETVGKGWKPSKRNLIEA